MILSGIADEAGKPIEAQIEAHKKLGWNNIEVRNVNSVNLTTVSDSDFDGIKRKLDEAGMQISCFASEIANWARKITGDFKLDTEELKRAIPRMKKTNTRYIRIMSYPNDGMEESAWHKEVLRRLKELTKIAEDGEIILAHENCSGWGGVSSENCLKLVEEVNSPSFKVLFDTGNPPAEGHDSWEFYNKVKPHIAYVHIKDCKSENDSRIFTFPGEGDGYVRKIVGALKSSGYEGVLSIEPHLAAIVHEGKEVEDDSRASEVYIKYGRQLQEILNQA